MSDRMMKILVVQEVDGSDLLPAASAEPDILPNYTVEYRNMSAETLHLLQDEGVDVVLLVVGGQSSDCPTIVRQTRQVSPIIPIIVVVNEHKDSIALAALRAGAQDCLFRSDIKEHSQLLARSIRFAVERGSYLAELDSSINERTRDRDAKSLQAIFTSGRLTVTERSLGQMSVRERHPAIFRALVNDYGNVLDSLVSPSASSTSATSDAQAKTLINAIADQLGHLGAGPRDVVDVHKAALALRIDGRDSRAARRALNYVEEGKLIVLQLMGQLVLHYRSYSWSKKDSSGPHAGRAAPPVESSIGNR